MRPGLMFPIVLPQSILGHPNYFLSRHFFWPITSFNNNNKKYLLTKFFWAPKIDAFELWCWRRFLRVPWTARRLNQSILKEISSEYSLEGLMKFQYFGHVVWRVDSLEKILMLGKIEGRRRRGWQRMRWLDGIIDSVNMTLSKLQVIVKDREAWCAVVHEVAESDMT